MLCKKGFFLSTGSFFLKKESVLQKKIKSVPRKKRNGGNFCVFNHRLHRFSQKKIGDTRYKSNLYPASAIIFSCPSCVISWFFLFFLFLFSFSFSYTGSPTIILSIIVASPVSILPLSFMSPSISCGVIRPTTILSTSVASPVSNLSL